MESNYSCEPRKVILNMGRIPEYIYAMGEDRIPSYGIGVVHYHLNEYFIEYLERNHSRLLRHCGIVIECIPPYFNWRIEDDDGYEKLVLEFPWEELARAYVCGDKYNPLREAIEEKRIHGFEEGEEPYVPEW
jgi:hypothetical protein